jgi:putative DNA primase/helicase
LEQYFPLRMYDAGYTDLISVSPPNAPLAPSSKLSPSQLGKAPARKNTAGFWGGYAWQRHETNREEVQQWLLDGANIGLKAARFPAIDIDTTDPQLVMLVTQLALSYLGHAPARVGKAPKRLLVYRAEEPFTRMRLWVEDKGAQHLIEVLGDGQQYLVHGVHPGTQRPYEWVDDPVGFPLTTITRAQASGFLDELQAALEMLGYVVGREGDGARRERSSASQHGLEAPNADALREAVRLIPNTDDLFPQRDDYVRMGVAIKAASQAFEHDGLEAFCEWAARSTSPRVSGNPETPREDWRRMHGPYSLGWGWLADMARGFGYNNAADELEALEEAPTEETGERKLPFLSDQWLAKRIIERRVGELRYVPATGRWLVWSGARWVVDEQLRAEHLIKTELGLIAAKVAEGGATPKELEEAKRNSNMVASQKKLVAVMALVKADPAIALLPDQLDHNHNMLNTPAGIVDLTTGQLGPAAPDALCTKSTAVAPDFNGGCPEWMRFLNEATQNDSALVAYLQRLAGYCLTGSIEEQAMVFIWGPGGNGKSVFLNVLTGIMADYAKTAPMDTFTSTKNDRHTTDLAGLMGARLVSASETGQGKVWDEARVKQLSGGDPVSARFMRQDNFTYRPTYKLVFVGNHKPEIRNVDAAMRRRIQLVPFTVTPARVDRQLGEKLAAEYPAILAWMIEGTRQWRAQGLTPPPVVVEAGAEYLKEQDSIGAWLHECCDEDAQATTLSQDLFSSWQEWANRNHEYVGSMKRLVQALQQRGFRKWQDPATRRYGFVGVSIRQDLGVLS